MGASWRRAVLRCGARQAAKKPRSSMAYVAFNALCFAAVRDVKSFPLNRRWRLAADVVGHAVDAAHFVDDAA